jgi:hypothetical protein
MHNPLLWTRHWTGLTNHWNQWRMMRTIGKMSGYRARHSMASGKFWRTVPVGLLLVQFSRDLNCLSLVSVSSTFLPISGRRRFFHLGLGRHSNAGYLSMLSPAYAERAYRPTINMFVITCSHLCSLSDESVGYYLYRAYWLVTNIAPPFDPDIDDGPLGVDPMIQDFQFGSLIRIVFGMQCLRTESKVYPNSLTL